MFAPVVLRFSSHDVALEGIAREYAQTTLANPHLQSWIAAGRLEKEVIAQDEAQQHCQQTRV